MSSSDKSKVNRYFQLHDAILEAMRKADYPTVARLAIESVSLIPALVQDTKREYGAFDLVESVAVDKGGKVLAALGREADLLEMHRILSSIAETQNWAEQVKLLIEDASLAEQILVHVRKSPETLQAELKLALRFPDGLRLSNICYWLAKTGRLKREKNGRSYRLYL